MPTVRHSKLLKGHLESNESIVHINVETTLTATSIGITTLIIGFVCNVCVITTICRTRCLRMSSINRAVLSLCAADLLTVAIDVPATLVILVGNHYEHMVMAFPVIALERYFSISNPFDKQGQIKRVNILTGLVWLFGILFSLVSVIVFPTTTVSMYCNVTLLQKEDVKDLFHKIYYFTFPLGIACVVVTVVSYGLIVLRVRKQNIKSLASNPRPAEFQRDTRRTRSYSGPTFSSAFSTFFTPGSEFMCTSASRDENETEIPSSGVQVTRCKRRKSLPSSQHQTKHRIFRGESSSLGPIPARKRPILRKADAFDEEDDDVIQMRKISSGSTSTTSQLLQVPDPVVPNKTRSISVASYGTTATQLHVPKARSVSVASCASSNATSLTSVPSDRSLASTAFNFSFDDQDSVFSPVETKKKKPLSKNGSGQDSNEGVQEEERKVCSGTKLTAPVIAITMVDGSATHNPEVHRHPSQRHHLQPPPPHSHDEASEYESRRRKSSFIMNQMRRCKSAMTSNECMEDRAKESMVVHSAEGLVRVYGAPRNEDFVQRRKISSNTSFRDKKFRRKSEIKTAKRSSFIVLTFLGVWLPLPVAVAVSNYYVDNHNSLEHLQWHLDMQLGTFCFGWLVTVTNPIIYGLAIRSFWVAFKKMASTDWNFVKNKFWHQHNT